MVEAAQGVNSKSTAWAHSMLYKQAKCGQSVPIVNNCVPVTSERSSSGSPNLNEWVPFGSYIAKFNFFQPLMWTAFFVFVPGMSSVVEHRVALHINVMPQLQKIGHKMHSRNWYKQLFNLTAAPLKTKRWTNAVLIFLTWNVLAGSLVIILCNTAGIDICSNKKNKSKRPHRCGADFITGWSLLTIYWLTNREIGEGDILYCERKEEETSAVSWYMFRKFSWRRWRRVGIKSDWIGLKYWTSRFIKPWPIPFCGCISGTTTQRCYLPASIFKGVRSVLA